MHGKKPPATILPLISEERIKVNLVALVRAACPLFRAGLRLVDPSERAGREIVVAVLVSLGEGAQSGFFVRRRELPF